MVKLTERDIAIIAGLAGATDFLTEGRFSAPVARAFKKHFMKGAAQAPSTVAGVARGLATGVRLNVGGLATGVRFLAVSHPLLTAGAVAVVAYHHREEIADLVEQGYNVVKPAAAPISQFLREEVFTPEHLERARESGVISSPLAARLKARKVSKFNKAVKAGMKAAKGSKYYGKKGTFNNSRKAFSAVTKIASKLRRGVKVSRTGSSGVIARAMPKWGTGPRSGR